MADLRQALASADPEVRAVAARVMATGSIALIPELSGALVREQDERAAVEMSRALVFATDGQSLPLVEGQLKRLGRPGVAVIADWMARTHPEELPAHLPQLAGAAGSPRALWDAVILAAREHPSQAGAILSAWANVVTGDDWYDTLDTLRPGPDVLLSALGSARATVREATVWFVLGQLAVSSEMSSDVLAAASATAPAGASDWESLGRSWASRAAHGQVDDRSSAVTAHAADHRAELVPLRDWRVLTSRERSAVKKALHGQDLPGGEPERSTIRTVDGFTPALVSSIFAATGCKTSPGAIGTASVAFGPDGRAKHVELNAASLPPGCSDALIAFARTAVVEPQDSSAAEDQILALPFSEEFAACSATNEPLSAPAAEPAPQADDAPIVPPRRVRNVNPIYPPVAEQNGVQGVVIVSAHVTPTGCVSGARVVRSIGPLDLAALTAVLQWQYTPALVDGHPTAVEMNVMVNFVLR